MGNRKEDRSPLASVVKWLILFPFLAAILFMVLQWFYFVFLIGLAGYFYFLHDSRKRKRNGKGREKDHGKGHGRKNVMTEKEFYHITTKMTPPNTFRYNHACRLQNLSGMQVRPSPPTRKKALHRNIQEQNDSDLYLCPFCYEKIPRSINTCPYCGIQIRK